MGWTGIPGMYGMTIKERKNYFDGIMTYNGRYNWGNKLTVVKSQMVGTVWYGAVKNVDTNNVFACVILTKLIDGELMYKELDEDCGPYYYDCPSGILKVLSNTTNVNALTWRKLCKENIDNKKNIRNAKKYRTGYIVETADGFIKKKTSRYTYFTRYMCDAYVFPTKEHAENAWVAWNKNDIDYYHPTAIKIVNGSIISKA